MNKKEITITYFAVALVFLISISIFHEGIHIMQNFGKVKDVCFLGIDDDKTTIAWVNAYGIKDIERQEFDATILTNIYVMVMTSLLAVGLFKSETDD